MTYKIYKLISRNTDKIYIGSTKQDLYKRLNEHKRHKNKYSSKELFLLGEVKIELVQDNINSKELALLLEGELIRLYKNICVNKRIEKRTIDEKKQTDYKWKHSIEYKNWKKIYEQSEKGKLINRQGARMIREKKRFSFIDTNLFL